MIRAVLDTNVFVSAFLLPGRLNRLVDFILQRAFIWLISEEILGEYFTVASRPLFKLSSKEVESLLYQVKERAEWVHIRSKVEVVIRDPSDDKFLACAIDGHADRVVTGDRDLLVLKSFRGIRIEKPAEFSRRLRV